MEKKSKCCGVEGVTQSKVYPPKSRADEYYTKIENEIVCSKCKKPFIPSQPNSEERDVAKEMVESFRKTQGLYDYNTIGGAGGSINSEEKECMGCYLKDPHQKECPLYSPKPEVWKCKCGGEMIYEGYKWLCRKCLNEAPKPEEKKPVDLCWCPHCSKGHFCNNPYHRGSTPPTEQSTEKCHCRGEFSHLIGIIHGSDKCFVPVFTPPNTPAWEVEFDEKFDGYMYADGGSWSIEDVKDFIKGLLQARDRELFEDIENILNFNSSEIMNGKQAVECIKEDIKRYKLELNKE